MLRIYWTDYRYKPISNKQQLGSSKNLKKKHNILVILWEDLVIVGDRLMTAGKIKDKRSAEDEEYPGLEFEETGTSYQWIIRNCRQQSENCCDDLQPPGRDENWRKIGHGRCSTVRH